MQAKRRPREIAIRKTSGRVRNPNVRKLSDAVLDKKEQSYQSDENIICVSRRALTIQTNFERGNAVHRQNSARCTRDFSGWY
jgi:hypothetical protein